MIAATLFFKGSRDGEGLPYLSEYLLCTDYGWSWRDLQEMPRSVLSYWLVYRRQQQAVQAAQAADSR